MKTRALITGASGFVGGKILEDLAKDKDFIISALSRNPDKLKGFEKQGVYVFKGDITKPNSLGDALSGQDVVIHCAALMSNFDSETRRTFYEINAGGTENILKACDPKTLKHFIHISTAGVYGACANKPTDEETPYGSALSTYEWSKKEAELKVLKQAEGKDMPFTILRPSQLYGAGMRYGWLDTIKAIKRGQMFILGKGDAKVHLLNIGDLVKAVRLVLLNKTAINKIYNIAGPEILSLREIFGTISEALGVKKPGTIPYLPIYLASVFLNFLPAGFKSGKLALLTPHRVRFFSTNHFYDISKATRELNYRPDIGIKDGFYGMVRWCEQEGLI